MTCQSSAFLHQPASAILPPRPDHPDAKETTPMSTIPLVGDDAPATRKTFEGVRTKLGLVPNLFRVLAQSPAALDGTLGLAGALGRGVLPAALRERIAIAIATANDCEYCLSAHAALGAGAGLRDADIDAATQGTAPAAKDTAAIRVALAVLRGEQDGALETLRAAGWDDAAAVEIVAHVALNLLTNRINTLAGTPVDFPLRRLPVAA
jgi:uncharacterized peroxidase-related enzyme